MAVVFIIWKQKEDVSEPEERPHSFLSFTVQRTFQATVQISVALRAIGAVQ